jgi:dihydrofolate reductase
MGRKNYDSLPDSYKPLPNRTNIIVTHQHNFIAGGCMVVHSIEAGIEIARSNREKELFIIGGAQIYEQALPLAHQLYLTEIKAEISGDTYFPEIDKDQWEEASRVAHAADEKHQFAFDFVIYKRKE